MQFLWKYIDDVVGKGLEIHVIAEFIFYASASFVSMAMPLAVLLASLMTFGNLGERYEIVAMKSAGIPLSKLMLPLALLTVLIGAFTFWFSNSVAPIAAMKASSRYYDIKTLKQAFRIDEGTFYDGLPNYIIRVGDKSPDGETVYDVVIYDHSQRQGNTTITHAEKGTMEMTPDGQYFMLTLYNGYYWDESANNSGGDSRLPLTRASFAKQYKKFDLSTFQLQKTDESFFSDRLLPTVEALTRDMDTINLEIKELRASIAEDCFENLHFFHSYYMTDSTMVAAPARKKTAEKKFALLPQENREEIFNYAIQSLNLTQNATFFMHEHIADKHKNYRRNAMELHRKFTVSVACFLFFFIGASFGSIIRKGGIGIPLVITVFFFTFHFALSLVGENIVKETDVPVFWGMWFSSLILLPICAFLTYKATVDSAVLSVESYGKWFKKVKQFFTKGGRR